MLLIRILSILFSLLLTKGSSNCSVSIASRIKMRENPFSKYKQYITIDDENAELPCLPAKAFSKYGEVKVMTICTCLIFWYTCLIWNSFAPARCGNNVWNVISEPMLRIKFMSTSREITPRWMPRNTFDDKSTLIQGMAWCRRASYWQRQCWPRSMPQYRFFRENCIK